MDFRNIIVEKRERIVCVTLNRPNVMNAFNAGMIEEMIHVFTEYRDNPDQWVMIITGAGERAFTTGIDVKEWGGQAKLAVDQMRPVVVDQMRPVVDLLQSIHKPFISAVNGYCLGGGWHLVCDSDIVIGSDNAIFMDTHVNIGMINGVESVGLAYKMPL
ncbi:MAG: enoyl-CoA hydratase/isomerase family protein, partial [Chloroflexota bacterium]